MTRSFEITRRTGLLLGLGALAACAAPQPPAPPAAPPEPQVPPDVARRYAALMDEGYTIPAVPDRYLTPRNVRQEVDYATDEKPGSVVVDPWQHFLYFILPEGRALRYGVAVGDEGRAFAGTAHIPYSRKWPSWLPTDNMLATQPEQYSDYADGLPGGLKNPLGARALYLHKGNRDTYYRIHGTNDIRSIGQSTSAGCIRMFNQDVIDLDTRVKSMARVVVLTPEQSQTGVTA
ncbi:L,D-transpeptidase [Falsirhodobacter sp. 1013]|uniref:L,D-transpeptidase n=1 Tax=Falsirhodobacter sp. 1013 TaxID=3417566 RepID=UPI003EBCA1B0